MNEEQLDLWVDTLYRMKEEAEEKCELKEVKVGSYREGYLKGFVDGLINALCVYTSIEKGKDRMFKRKLEERKNKSGDNK